MLRIFSLTTFLLSAFAAALFAQEARLAREYFSNGEYEKAAELYKKLHEKERTHDYYYERYLTTLLELEDYKEAEQVVKKSIKLEPAKVQRYVDYGMIFERQGLKDQAKEQFDKAIKLVPGEQEPVTKIAGAFIAIKQYDYALLTYERGAKLLKEKYIFSYEIGNVYRMQNKIPEMTLHYLDCLEYVPNQLTNVQAFFQKMLPGSQGGYFDLKNQLYDRIQKSTNTIYPEMLIWVFTQEGDYIGALRQAKAIDKRLNENGTRIYRLAQTAIAEKKYDAGIEAYAYLIEKGIGCSYYIDAKQRLLAAKRDKMVDGFAYTQADLVQLESEYESFLNEFGRNTNTATIMQELAEFESFYLNNINKAIGILEEMIKLPNLQRQNIAEAKLDLGDYYLMKGEVWESTLLYSQVDKEMRDAPLGETARFKNAKLSYYRGDFEWAQDQLDVLKGSTSELISNDAIDLSVFIMEHYNLDTTAVNMRRFATADLLIFQNKIEEAFVVMDSILNPVLPPWVKDSTKTPPPPHGLADDILLAKANIYIKKRDYETAIKLYDRIVNEHKEGILVDNALFKTAELYETRLNNPGKAMELYQKILIDHSGSTFTVEARKRFRRLRGDNV